MNNANDMFKFSVKLWYEKRNISANGDVSLYLQVVIDRKHKAFPLQLRWPHDRVDLANDVLLPRAKVDDDISDYNMIIATERSKYNEIFKVYRLKNQTLTIQEFSNQIKVFDNKESFIAFLERERNLRYKRGEIDKRTWLNAHAVKLMIIKYDPVASFKSIDKKWMTGFVSFIRKTKKSDGSNYSASSLWGFIKVTKAYLQRALVDPLLSVNAEAANFTNKEPKTLPTFLNEEEVRRLLILLKSGALTELQSRVLNAFLFSCFTSVRISDLYRISANLKISDDYILFLPFKGRKHGHWLKLPISDLAKKFIHNVNGQFFNIPNATQFNETLKEISFKAEISKRLTSHVGRHTFGYLYMVTVGNLYALKEIMGHTKIETTLKYAHLDEMYKKSSVNKLNDTFSDLVLIKKAG